MWLLSQGSYVKYVIGPQELRDMNQFQLWCVKVKHPRLKQPRGCFAPAVRWTRGPGFRFPHGSPFTPDTY